MRPETQYLHRGINLVISFQREIVMGILAKLPSIEDPKTKSAMEDVCTECSILIEAARLYAMEEANVLSSST